MFKIMIEEEDNVSEKFGGQQGEDWAVDSAAEA